MSGTDPGQRRCAPQGADPSWLSVDIVFEDEGWQDPVQAEALIRQAAAAVAMHGVMAGLQASEACLALSNDAHVQTLNANFRGKDQPTNVLSFPAPDKPMPNAPQQLGDIIIARETIEREARERGIPYADHLRHLAVHGLLHLLGYDHETDEEALEMERLEIEILARLMIPDPYGDRDD